MAKVENVTLNLHYSVQPWVGLLTWDQSIDLGLWKKMKDGVSKSFSLPEVKKKEEPKKKKTT